MSNKKGFTLLELVIAIGIIGAGLIAVFIVLNSGFSTMAQARGQIIAINLAREGAETMFNLRDTNLRKRSGKKDLCRLNAKGIFSVDPQLCEDELWLGYYGVDSGIQYIPLLVPFGASKVPFMFPMEGGAAAWLNIFDADMNADAPYEIFVTSSGEFLSSALFSGTLIEDGCFGVDDVGTVTVETEGCHPVAYPSAGKFYRTINNVGLYDKSPIVSGGNNMQCANGAATDTVGSGPCGGADAKELRFCSEVQYIIDGAKRRVAMCSVLTNFKE